MTLEMYPETLTELIEKDMEPDRAINLILRYLGSLISTWQDMTNFSKEMYFSKEIFVNVTFPSLKSWLAGTLSYDVKYLFLQKIQVDSYLN